MTFNIPKAYLRGSPRSHGTLDIAGAPLWGPFGPPRGAQSDSGDSSGDKSPLQQARRLQRLPSINFRPTALTQYKEMLTNKDGNKIAICELIESHNVTILLYGSPRLQRFVEAVSTLQVLARAAEVVGRTMAIMYIPVFTGYETREDVEKDFHANHGNWWMMAYMSQEAMEATLMHAVNDRNLPALVVVDRHGLVLAEIEQKDLKDVTVEVLDKWF